MLIALCIPYAVRVRFGCLTILINGVENDETLNKLDRIKICQIEKKTEQGLAREVHRIANLPLRIEKPEA
jgi:hypothetical protein